MGSIYIWTSDRENVRSNPFPDKAGITVIALKFTNTSAFPSFGTIYNFSGYNIIWYYFFWLMIYPVDLKNLLVPCFSK